MALANASIFEVRSTGSDNNGGGFDSSKGGTDWTQSDNPKYAFTDLAALLATSGAPTITSASRVFDSTDAGNYINIPTNTGSGNWVTGVFEIISVTAGVATLDRACGTGASPTGGTWNEGGGFATIGKAITAITVGYSAGGPSAYIVYIKASANYTITATLTIPSTSKACFIGYTTTRTDGGQATITTATNSTSLITSAAGATNLLFRNIKFTNTASTRDRAFNFSSGTNTHQIFFDNCVFDGVSNVYVQSGSSTFAPVVFKDCEIKNTTGDAITATQGVSYLMFLIGTVVHDCIGNGISFTNNSGGVGSCLVLINSIVKSCADGIHISVSNQSPFILCKNSAILNNSGDNILLTVGSTQWANFLIDDTVIDNAGGWGIHQTAVGGVQFGVLRNNAYESNFSGDTTFQSSKPLTPTETGKVTLTADPFTARASLDFSLNNASGGGALCRSTGYPGALPIGGTGYSDIGPLHHPDNAVVVAPRITQYVVEEL